MDRSWVLSLLLLVLFVSNASSFSKFRELGDEEAPKDNSNSTTTQNSTLPSPKPVEDVKSNLTSSEPPLPTRNSTNPNPEKKPDSVGPPPPQLTPENEKNTTTVSNATQPVSPPPANQTDSQDNGKLPAKMAPPPPKSSEAEKNGTEAGKGNPPPAKDPEKVNDVEGSSESGSTETCAGKSNICRTENSLVACTLSIDKGSSKWLVLVQNEGETSLKTNIILPAIPKRELTLPKHQSQRVNISISGDTNKIILDAGKGECVLHMYPAEQSSLYFHLPSYEQLVTPINGAYFLIVSVVIFGGIWGCCLCRKNRRAGSGVPYRELELSGGPGLEGESAVHDVETADWDEGWDDDWENNAVKSPGGAAHSVSISANGLTARAPNRDGWDHDWDD